jgi:hypothetical protein
MPTFGDHSPVTSADSSSAESKSDGEDIPIPGDDGSIAGNSMVSEGGDLGTAGGKTDGNGKTSDDPSLIRTWVASRMCCYLLVLVTGALAGIVTYLVTANDQDQAVQSQVRLVCERKFMPVLQE